MTGLVKCGYCGKAMVVRSYKDTKYFNCSGRAIKMCDADVTTVYVADVEELVTEKIKNFVSNFNNCKIEAFENDNKTEINNIKIDLVKIDTEINNIVNNLSSANDVLIKYANQKIVELDNKKNKLLNKLNEITFKRERKLNMPDVTDFNIRDIEYKKTVANMLINKVSVYSDKIKIDWKY